jgi:hypothetical protein
MGGGLGSTVTQRVVSAEGKFEGEGSIQHEMNVAQNGKYVERFQHSSEFGRELIIFSISLKISEYLFLA